MTPRLLSHERNVGVFVTAARGGQCVVGGGDGCVSARGSPSTTNEGGGIVGGWANVVRGARP